MRRRALAGFTLLELLIALFFTGILMAGLARVFRGSFTTFVTANEGLSALRKNRMALDLLQDDFNQVGMFPTKLSNLPTGMSSGNEPFRVDPDQSTDAVSGKTSDHLYMMWDEAMPLDATLVGSGTGGTVFESSSVLDLAAQGGTLGTGPSIGNTSDCSFDCKDPVMAQAVVDMINRTGGRPKLVLRSAVASVMAMTTGSASRSGSVVTAKWDQSEAGTMSPLGPSGDQKFIRGNPQAGDGLLAINSLQQFRYRVVDRTVAPGQTAPCLVREQGTYNAGGFVADASLTTVVTEFVEQFKVYFSVDRGTTWVGLTAAAGDWATMKAQLTSKLQTVGRAGPGSDLSNVHWYREVPTLVRVDVTTRTPTKRAEYGTTGFQTKTQSLVVMPRHFGLPY